MQASDYLILTGEISVLSDRTGGVLEWEKKFCVVTQDSLIIYKKRQFSEAEDLKVQLKGALVQAFPADSVGHPSATLIELAFKNISRGLLIESESSAKDWVYCLTFAASWGNYESFCSFRKLHPMTYLLKWGATRQSKLCLDFATTNQYGVIEFFRRNSCITELEVAHLDSHHDILIKVFRCFHPTQLLALSLSAARLRDESFASLSQAISAHCKLTKLDLSRNFLTVKTVSLILKLSAQLPFLEDLSLRENPLQDAAVEVLLPAVFHTLDLKELDLTSCRLTDDSAETVQRTLSILDLPLQVLKLNDNALSSTAKAKILHTLRTLRGRGVAIKVDLNPLEADHELIEELIIPSEVGIIRNKAAVDDSQEDSRIYKSKTLAKISSQVRNLTNAESSSEDLRKLAGELVDLESHYPKANVRELQDTVCEKLDQAIALDDFYFIETLYNAAKSLGIRHKAAEAKLEDLRRRAEGVTELLRYVLNPKNYKKAVLSELNVKLDQAVEDAKRIGLRGELVTAALNLVSLRTQYL